VRVHFSPTTYLDLAEKRSGLNPFLKRYPFACFYIIFKNPKQSKHSSEHTNFNRWNFGFSMC